MGGLDLCPDCDRESIVSIYSDNYDLYMEMLLVMDSAKLLPAHKAVIFAVVAVDEKPDFVHQVRTKMECDRVDMREKVNLINHLQERVGVPRRARLHNCFNVFMEPIKKAS
jgi:hypothetical protein